MNKVATITKKTNGVERPSPLDSPQTACKKDKIQKKADIILPFAFFLLLLHQSNHNITKLKTINLKTMGLVEQIIARAKANKQRIVLPEADEERTLVAADQVLEQGIADLILIGNPAKVQALVEKNGLKNIGKATFIDPENYEKSEEMAQLLQKLREKKGMTIEQARELVKNPLYLGCMIIKTEGADGQISGALSTTGDTLRPALQIIKTAPGITCVSGAMLMITETPQYGENGVMVSLTLL